MLQEPQLKHIPRQECFGPEYRRFLIGTRAYLDESYNIIEQYSQKQHCDEPQLENYITIDGIPKSGPLIAGYSRWVSQLQALPALSQEMEDHFEHMTWFWFVLARQAIWEYGMVPLRGVRISQYGLARLDGIMTDYMEESLKQEMIHFRKRILEKSLSGTPIFTHYWEANATNPRAMSWSPSIVQGVAEAPEWNAKIYYRLDEIQLRGISSEQGRLELVKIVAHFVGALARIRVDRAYLQRREVSINITPSAIR
jgi:hypothetical protein